MVHLVLKFLCALLFASGFFFVLTELRARFSRGLLYFGLTSMLLCAFAFIDIWIFPRTPIEEKIYWYRIQHVISVWVLPVLLSYLLELVESPSSRLIRAQCAISAVFSVLFMSDLLLRPGADGRMALTVLYEVTYVPYILSYIVGLHVLMRRRMKSATEAQKRFIHIIFFGFLLLCGFGVLDILHLLGYLPSTGIPSFTILGILAFGVVNTIVFAEHQLLLVTDYRATYRKLEEAYRDLEEANSLKELGRSSAMIAHEINNYMAGIMGGADMLLQSEHLSPGGTKIVTRIGEAVERLSGFSNDVLAMSKSQFIREMSPIDLAGVIRSCIDDTFPGRAGSFRLENFEPGLWIRGDWGKLDQVFVNIFKNSLEAGSTEIRVSLAREGGIILVSVDDNGTGCAEEQVPLIFKAFHTTKPRHQGTGLGMSIVRAVVESHGGYVSAYTKNTLGGEQHGLTINLTFPACDEEGHERKPEQMRRVMVIRDELDSFPGVLQVLRNVRIDPELVRSVADIRSHETSSLDAAVIGSPRPLAEIRRRYPGVETFAVVSTPTKAQYVIESAGHDAPRILSEEFVLSRIIRRTQR